MAHITLPAQLTQASDDYSGADRHASEAPWVVAEAGNDWTSALVVPDLQTLPMQVLSMQPLLATHSVTTTGHPRESSGNIQSTARRPLTSTFNETVSGYNYGTSTLADTRTGMLVGQGREHSAFDGAAANHCVQLPEGGPRTFATGIGASQTPGGLSQSPNTHAFESPTSFTALSLDLHSNNQENWPDARQGATSTVQAGDQQCPEHMWDLYKPIIERLYLHEDRPLHEVMHIMADQYHFRASLKMYKSRFAIWGFRKNITDKEARVLNVKWQRQNVGKTTQFLGPSNRVINLKKYLKRRNKSEYHMVDLSRVAQLPERIRCLTPPPIPRFLESPEFQGAQEKLIANIKVVFKTWYEQELRDGKRPLDMRLSRTGDDMVSRLVRASRLLQRGSDSGVQALSLAEENLEMDLSGRSPIATMRLVFEYRNWMHQGMMMMLWRYINAYGSRHPLCEGLRAIYSILDGQGIPSFRDLLDDCIERAAEQIELIYGENHPVTLGCWDLVANFYSQKNPRRIDAIYDRLRKRHETVVATSGQGSLEELELRYCYAFHLCYGHQSKRDETVRYLSDFLKVLRDGENQDKAMEEWCLARLTDLNYEVSSPTRPQAEYSPRSIFCSGRCPQAATSLPDGQ